MGIMNVSVLLRHWTYYLSRGKMNSSHIFYIVLFGICGGLRFVLKYRLMLIVQNGVGTAALSEAWPIHDSNLPGVHLAFWSSLVIWCPTCWSRVDPDVCWGNEPKSATLARSCKLHHVRSYTFFSFLDNLWAVPSVDMPRSVPFSGARAFHAAKTPILHSFFGWKCGVLLFVREYTLMLLPVEICSGLWSCRWLRPSTMQRARSFILFIAKYMELISRSKTQSNVTPCKNVFQAKTIAEAQFLHLVLRHIF